MKGFKTVVLGLAVGGVALLSDESAKQFILDHFEVTGGALGTLIIILRALTDSPMFKKEGEQ